MIEFVVSGLYFVQDENYFINPLLQVGSGSDEKNTGYGGPKINGSDRIRILIPGLIDVDTPISRCEDSYSYNWSLFLGMSYCG